MNLADFKLAATKVLARMTAVAAERRAEEQADVMSAVQDHAPLGDGYWKGRHEAERRGQTATRLLEAINEIEGEGNGKR